MVEVAGRQKKDSGPWDLAEPSGKEPRMEYRFGGKNIRENEDPDCELSGGVKYLCTHLKISREAPETTNIAQTLGCPS